MMKKTEIFGYCVDLHTNKPFLKSYTGYRTEYCVVAKLSEHNWAVIDEESGLISFHSYRTRKEALENYPLFECELTRVINEKYEEYEGICQKYNELKKEL